VFFYFYFKCGGNTQYEPLLPNVQEEDEFVTLLDQKTRELYENVKTPPPKTWQYHCLLFQEGTVATGLVCGMLYIQPPQAPNSRHYDCESELNCHHCAQFPISYPHHPGLVIFELLWVGEQDDTGQFSTRFLWGLFVSMIFLFEICLRFYTWWSTVRQWADSKIIVGGFLSNPFRFLDALLVLVDMVILLMTLVTPTDSASSAKATVKLARVVRFARSARWIRGAKMLRSCRFFANLGHHWRQSSRPQKPDVVDAIADCFRELEERGAWAGRDATVEMCVCGKKENHNAYLFAKSLCLLPESLFLQFF
jgi:hypothetical protein